MKGRISGFGRGANIKEGLCKIEMTSESECQSKFLRALFNQWFYGWDEEGDKVLVDAFWPMFERAGWTPPSPMGSEPTSIACGLCGGDCSGAMPPVTDCPMRTP